MIESWVKVMGNTESKRRLPAPERRRVIEDAAAALFAEHGYSATKLADVAHAAGITKQLLHRHFKSKKELHLILLAQHRDALLLQLAESMSAPGPLSERIPRAIDEWFAHVQSNRYTWGLLFRDTTGDPDVEAFHHELHASARAAIMNLIGSQTEVDVPEENVEALAELIRSAMVGLALWWLEHRELPRSTIVKVASDALRTTSS